MFHQLVLGWRWADLVKVSELVKVGNVNDGVWYWSRLCIFAHACMISCGRYNHRLECSILYKML